MLSRPPAPSMTKCRLSAQALIHSDAYYYLIHPHPTSYIAPEINCLSAGTFWCLLSEAVQMWSPWAYKIFTATYKPQASLHQKQRNVLISYYRSPNQLLPSLSHPNRFMIRQNQFILGCMMVS